MRQRLVYVKIHWFLLKLRVELCAREEYDYRLSDWTADLQSCLWRYGNHEMCAGHIWTITIIHIVCIGPTSWKQQTWNICSRSFARSLFLPFDEPSKMVVITTTAAVAEEIKRLMLKGLSMYTIYPSICSFLYLWMAGKKDFGAIFTLVLFLFVSVFVSLIFLVKKKKRFLHSFLLSFRLFSLFLI